MSYDVKPPEAPRLSGNLLRIVAAMAERSSSRSALVRKLLEGTGVLDLRSTLAGDTPAFYCWPLGAEDHGIHEEGGGPDRARLIPRTEEVPDLQALYGSVEGEGRLETAARFRAAYTEGSTTPLQVAERFIAALEADRGAESPLGAYVSFLPEDLLEQARASTGRYREGATVSPLDGVPVTVKDELDQRPHRTRVGTTFLGEAPATVDAEPVARLRRAGALLVGKASMHELGLGVTGINPHSGTPRNPHDPERAPGGSSSGSAVAVAAGLSPVALGADGGGSIRIPAAFCGIVGLKPTFGRVSEHGAAPLCWSMAHVGPMGRTIRDVALAYSLIAGPDPKDENTRRQPDPVLPPLQDPELDGLVVGVYPPWFEDAEDEIVRLGHAALTALEDAGATVREVEIPEIALLSTVHLVTIVSEIVTSQLHHRGRTGQLAPETRLNLALGRALGNTDYIHAQRHRIRLARHFRQLFREIDLLATPTSALSPPRLEPAALATGSSDLVTTAGILRFVQAANLFGLPAISVPVGATETALPVGLHLMARAWEEHLLLLAGQALEQARPPPVPKRLHRLLP